MWNRLRSIICAICLGLSTISPNASYGQAPAALAGITIGGFLESVRATIKQLEDSAHSLIDHGNIALAQQQMLLAGILRSLVQQVGVTYATALDKTFNQISVTEQNTFGQLFLAMDTVKDLEKKSFTDVQAVIYKTQGAANQLLDRLPLTSRYPIFYGASVRDLTSQPAQHPADLELLGFHFTDPALNSKKPKVSVAGEVISETLLSVQEDRVQVQIPDAIKNKIGFGNPACEPRKTFQIVTKVFWGEARGLFWPLRWTSEREIDFNVNALPGVELYEIKVSYDGTRTSSSLKQENFSVKSGSVNMGCEQSTAASARFEAPAGAQEIQCTASWVDTSNVKNQSQNCAVGGTVATGSGSLTGRDKQCLPTPPFGPRICNCPGGGHGSLQIAGSYKVPESKTQDIKNAVVGTYVMRQGASISASLPVDSAVKFNAITVVFSRKGCEKEYDRIVINVPANPDQNIAQNSANGHFKASLWHGQLAVSDH